MTFPVQQPETRGRSCSSLRPPSCGWPGGHFSATAPGPPNLPLTMVMFQATPLHTSMPQDMPFLLLSDSHSLPTSCPTTELSRGDREIGVLRNVEPPTRPRLEFRRETGLILRSDRKVVLHGSAGVPGKSYRQRSLVHGVARIRQNTTIATNLWCMLRC